MPIIFKGAVNNVEPPKQPERELPKQYTFSQIKAQSQVNLTPSLRPKEVPETKPNKPQNANSDLIKPKYMKDKSVYYKSSGYLKDLLGEGN